MPANRQSAFGNQPKHNPERDGTYSQLIRWESCANLTRLEPARSFAGGIFDNLIANSGLPFHPKKQKRETPGCVLEGLTE